MARLLEPFDREGVDLLRLEGLGLFVEEEPFDDGRLTEDFLLLDGLLDFDVLRPEFLEDLSRVTDLLVRLLSSRSFERTVLFSIDRLMLPARCSVLLRASFVHRDSFRSRVLRNASRERSAPCTTFR